MTNNTSITHIPGFLQLLPVRAGGKSRQQGEHTFMFVSGSLRGREGDIFPPVISVGYPNRTGWSETALKTPLWGLRCSAARHTLKHCQRRTNKTKVQSKDVRMKPKVKRLPQTCSRAKKWQPRIKTDPSARSWRARVSPLRCPFKRTLQLWQNTKVNQVTEDWEDTTTEAKMGFALCVLKDAAEPNLHLVSKLR